MAKDERHRESDFHDQQGVKRTHRKIDLQVFIFYFLREDSLFYGVTVIAF
jgi:hypothetical protein